MLVDPDGLALVCAICGALGFAAGWIGGYVRGRNAGVTGTLNDQQEKP